MPVLVFIPLLFIPQQIETTVSITIGKCFVIQFGMLLSNPCIYLNNYCSDR